ncbi:MAG: amino acid ABC transporter substrate-binding protein [Crenarchaeota archaeon]|nr:amino acid ABC transporter substrate-binding protein [Thermoproteota archaeon]
MVSKKVGAIVAGIIIAIIVIGVAAWYATSHKAAPSRPTPTKTTPTTPTTKPSAPSKTTTITIGFLLPLTGGLSSDGVLNKYVGQIAIHDINSWLASAGLPYRFTAAFYDTATSYTGAIKAYEAAVSAGIKLIIGPMSSLALSAIYKKAAADHVIVVSQSSTAMSLHVPKPYVFRLAPPDMWQSKALATVIKDLGIKAVCIIYRVDPWGKGLTEYLEKHLKDYGIEYKAIGYPPTASTYTSYVAALDGCVKSFASKYGYDHVAVEAITFDEIAYILRTASGYPELMKVLWLGCDGFAGSPAVYKVCPIAVKVRLLSTVVGLPESRMNWLKERVLKQHPGVVGTWEYASIEYDAVWVVALSALKSYLDKGTLDTAYINQILPEVAYLYSIGKPIPTAKGELSGPWVTGSLWGKGALTGVIKLDADHDRMGANYNIYAIIPSGSTCTWKLVGMWNMQTGKIVEYYSKAFILPS